MIQLNQRRPVTLSYNEERIAKMGKFIVKETKTGVKFDHTAGHGEVIATSEVYSAEKSCLNGIASVRTNCDDPDRSSRSF